MIALSGVLSSWDMFARNSRLCRFASSTSFVRSETLRSSPAVYSDNSSAIWLNSFASDSLSSPVVTVSRAHTGAAEWRSPEELEAEAVRLLEPFFDARENPKGKKIRLIGVRVEKLSRPSG